MRNEILIGVLEEIFADILIDIPIYADVLPVNAELPCMRFEVEHTVPFHTKDGVDLEKTIFSCNIFSTDGGSVNGEQKDSAYGYVYRVTQLIETYVNQYVLTDDVKGIKVEDVYDEYNDEAGVFFTTFELSLITEVDNMVMFSDTLRKTGNKVEGQDVWCQTFNLNASELTLGKLFLPYSLDDIKLIGETGKWTSTLVTEFGTSYNVVSAQLRIDSNKIYYYWFVPSYTELLGSATIYFIYR